MVWSLDKNYRWSLASTFKNIDLATIWPATINIILRHHPYSRPQSASSRLFCPNFYASEFLMKFWSDFSGSILSMSIPFSQWGQFQVAVFYTDIDVSVGIILDNGMKGVPNWDSQWRVRSVPYGVTWYSSLCESGTTWTHQLFKSSKSSKNVLFWVKAGTASIVILFLCLKFSFSCNENFSTSIDRQKRNL